MPVFVKKKKQAGQRAKKFSPTPLWVGAPSVSNSPSTLIGALDNKAGTSQATPADKKGDKHAAQRRRSQEEAAKKARD